MCQNGAREVQQKVLETIESDNLRVFVVWTPRYKGDSRAKAVTATKIITDKRARQFWDAGGYIGARYAQTLKLPRNARFAWDVYFVFDSQAQLKDKPPLPDKWMHQLSRSQEWKESRLDGDTFRKYVADLLEDE